MPDITKTITGDVVGEGIIRDTGRGMTIRRIEVSTSVAGPLRIYRGETDDANSKFFDLESSNGIQLWFDEPGFGKGFPSEGDLHFTGGTAGEDVVIIITYDDVKRDRTGNDTPTGILLPWYNYPNFYDPPNYKWPDVVAEHTPSSPVTAIINPNSGPDGDGPNSDYIVGCDLFRDAGIKMLGYVTTNYGARDIALLKADILLYAERWGNYISGIFFDETPDAHDAADIAYYREATNYAREQFAAFGQQNVLLVSNPGTDQAVEYYPFFDVICTFEQTEANWAANKAILNPDPAGRVKHCALVYEASSDGQDRQERVKEAYAEGYRYVYVTDDTSANPWDVLDTQWGLQQRFQRRLNGGLAKD